MVKERAIAKDSTIQYDRDTNPVRTIAKDRDIISVRTEPEDRVTLVEGTNMDERDIGGESATNQNRDKSPARTIQYDRVTVHEGTIYEERPNWLDRLLTARAMKKKNRRWFQLNHAINLISQHENKTTV